MTGDEQLQARSDDVDAQFRAVLESTPIHRGRWRALLAAVIILPSVTIGGGLWYVGRSGCEATNRATDKVERVVDALTAPVSAAPGAGAPLRRQTATANGVRRVVRSLTHRLLAPEGC